MKRSRLLLLLVVGLLTVPLAVSFAGSSAEGARTLEGEYYSNNNGDGPVKARFTPDGERGWKVAFDFTFNGRQHTYRGTADGSFFDGALSGRVKNEYGRRTFTFRGSFADGEFRGTHAEIYRGREQPTGTLVMRE